MEKMTKTTHMLGAGAVTILSLVGLSLMPVAAAASSSAKQHGSDILGDCAGTDGVCRKDDGGICVAFVLGSCQMGLGGPCDHLVGVLCYDYVETCQVYTLLGCVGF